MHVAAPRRTAWSPANPVTLRASVVSLAIAALSLFAGAASMADDALPAAKPAAASTAATTPPAVLRVMPVGDSITRGSYLARHEVGPFAGTVYGLPHPLGGGWRWQLQRRLRAAGVSYDFVGDVDYGAHGLAPGVADPDFDPQHQGLAGFSNRGIRDGGVVPTPPDVLAALGLKEFKVSGIVDALKRHHPDVILLMSGANGFDAPARDNLLTTIANASDAKLFVATIPPQGPPRAGWEKAVPYNASLPAIVAKLQGEGHAIYLVDVHAAVSPDDLLTDGVHPNAVGMDKIAAAWYAALADAALVPALSDDALDAAMAAAAPAGGAAKPAPTAPPEP